MADTKSTKEASDSENAHWEFPSRSQDPAIFIKSPEEKRLVRKLDRRILPLACLLYLFAYLDRSNLGNARLLGIDDDVLGGDPTGILFDWVNSVFFLTYILCQVPATVLSKLYQPRIWMACSAMGWGLCSALMSTAFNFPGMLVTRVFLGVFEAGFGPAIPLYFSLFYTKAEMGLRMAYWFGFAAVAGAFGGLIAFGIQGAHISLAGWRLLFVVEGVPAMLLGLSTLFLLPNRPESTSYLTEEERAIALERMNRATSGDTGAVLNKAHLRMAFRDWKVNSTHVYPWHLVILVLPRFTLQALSTLVSTTPLHRSLLSYPPSSRLLIMRMLRLS
jgi:MFS family permease